MSLNTLDNHLISYIPDIKEQLKNAGISNFFAHKDGYIIVKESDPVQVHISVIGGITEVKTKFPQIGNGVQIVITLFIFFSGIASFLPIPFLSAVLLGQLFSYFWFTPKTKKLKEKIETILAQE